MIHEDDILSMGTDELATINIAELESLGDTARIARERDQQRIEEAFGDRICSPTNPNGIVVRYSEGYWEIWGEGDGSLDLYETADEAIAEVEKWGGQ
jgi:hypothetical protein